MLENPAELILAWNLREVMPALSRIDIAAAREGVRLAGYIAFEAAPAFDDAFEAGEIAIPLLQFGVFPVSRSLGLRLPPATNDYRLGTWSFAESDEEYLASVRSAKASISRGDIYQVNLTRRLRASFEGDPYGLFRMLAERQPSPHVAYCRSDKVTIVSASPELFFEFNNGDIVLKPMKGTRKRGLTVFEDDEAARDLAASEKDRSENVMIVDVIRNDISRVSVEGSVSVRTLFDVEQYPTIWQMTSCVHARSEAPISSLLRALFPCASISGAPKVAAMKLIRRLETRPRGAYTGSLGVIGPGRRACFNVAIRTVSIDEEIGMAEYGVGGGIVDGSDPDGELAECLAKTSILHEHDAPFSLLETFRFDPEDGYVLLSYHLDRLSRSARYFGVPLSVRDIEEALVSHAPARISKVRLLVDRGGQWQISDEPLRVKRAVPEVLLKIAASPVDSNDVFLYHKTTRREVYERASRERGDADDVLLWNERGEITEGTIWNIAVECGGRWITPRVSCGLLAGTLRASLLDLGEIEEGTIECAYVRRERPLMRVFNSVRGVLPARILVE